jgi:hypothetical protein
MSPTILALRSVALALMLVLGLFVPSLARPKKQHSFDWQRQEAAPPAISTLPSIRSTQRM